MKVELKALGKKELKEVSDYCLALLQTSETSTASDATRLQNLWTASLANALSEKFGNTVSPKLPPTLAKELKASYGHAQSLYVALSPSRQGVDEAAPVFNFLARALVKYCSQVSSRIGAPLSFKFILGQSQVLPGLFENSFPGYLQSGLGHVVLTKLLERKANVR